MNDDIFRFVVVRPPQRQVSLSQRQVTVQAYSRELTQFAQTIRNHQSAEDAVQAALKFIASSRYVSDLLQLKLPLHQLDIDFLSYLTRPLSDARSMVERRMSVPAEKIINSDEFWNARDRLADSLLAVVLSGQGYTKGQERLVRGLQVLAAIEAIAQPEATRSAFLAALRGIVLLPFLPELIFPPKVRIPATTGHVRIAGVGDLLVVRQNIKRYELGEIAHIENALRGEAYGRTFRRKEGLEIVEFEEIEKSETTERDLQSTSKYELRNEAERTIQEDLSVEAGVTVTARGPSVEVNANAGFAYERSSEESTKAATTFARDVVDRSVSKIQERVLRRRSSKITQETEETAEHRIDNTSQPDHLIGIYRWVEKIYEAQIVNYGQRLILEFVVPEPAAFYRMARENRRLPSVTAVLPEPPQILDAVSRELRPLMVSDISEGSYLAWVSQYNVTGVSPPPASAVFIGVSLEQGARESGRSSASKIVEQGGLKVPAGYIASTIYIDNAGDVETADRYWELIVGTKEFKSGTSKVQRLTADERYDDIIPVSMVVKDYDSFTVNVVVKCDRTPAKLREWQSQTFNSILSQYAKLKADYDDQVAASQLQAGVGIAGRNPFANRDVERNELKRLSIATISGQNFDLFDAMSNSGAPLNYPQVTDFVEAKEEGNYIQFLEQALEWRYMTYVFYPYFWGRKSGWVDVLNSDDSDPLFSQFLSAGAARVQVPVRPGFVEAMDYFLKRGIPWNGGEPPHFDESEAGSPPFVPIIQELREQANAEFEAGEGSVTVRENSVDVVGTDTEFEETRDGDREIRIGNQTYRIRQVRSPNEIVLWTAYSGSDAENLPYSLGPKLVGQPWEVRLPTTLVMLQSDALLPSFTG